MISSFSSKKSQLITKFYPKAHGLQSTHLGENKAFEIKRDDFVQVLHTGYGHWITISTYYICELEVINVFDSLIPAITSTI